MSQTSYAINLNAAAYPGQIADSGFKDVLSAINVAAEIPYGLLAVVDSSNTSDFSELAVKLPAASTDITTAGKQLGVVLADQARAQNPAVSGPQYPQNSAVSCGRKGRFWVQPESAVTDGGKVYCRWQTGDNGSQPGAFGGVLDTSVVGNALLTGAVWRGTYAYVSGGYAVIEMDLV
jgi:hypothetical protein